jgi:hypothetical protein
MTTTIADIPFQLPIVILALLLFISTILSARSGWHRIATRFPYKKIEDPRKFYFVRMSLGSGSFPVAYGGCVFVRLSPHGLGLSVIFLFRYMHRPIFIPWSDVSRCVRETARSDVTKISLHDEKSVFSFYGKVGESIYETYLSENTKRES